VTAVADLAEGNSNYYFDDCQGFRGKARSLFLKLPLITLRCNREINRVFNQGEYLQ